LAYDCDRVREVVARVPVSTVAGVLGQLVFRAGAALRLHAHRGHEEIVSDLGACWLGSGEFVHLVDQGDEWDGELEVGSVVAGLSTVG
jgi:hypothetical protein